MISGPEQEKSKIARRKRPPPEPVKPLGPRINEQIRISPVRLIGDAGEQMGVVETGEAMMHARDQGLDLVEVSPKERPVVCKLMDFGRYKYEQKKRGQEAKRKEKNAQIKTVRFRPNIEEHDFQTKVNRAERFLIAGDKVKIDIQFRRREMRQAHSGKGMLNRITERFEEFARVESREDRITNRTMSMLLFPIENKIAALKERRRRERLAAGKTSTVEDSELDSDSGELDSDSGEELIVSVEESTETVEESTEAVEESTGSGGETTESK